MKQLIDQPCTSRPGILKVMVDGKLEVAVHQGKSDRPYVMHCECEAKNSVFDIGISLLAAVALGGKLRAKILPQDFFYDYVDEVPKELDADVGDLTEANKALASILKTTKE